MKKTEIISENIYSSPELRTEDVIVEAGFAASTQDVTEDVINIPW